MANAREKLNAAHFNGALIIAVITWITTGSFLVGAVVFAGILGMANYSGDIRLKPKDHS